jgi:hypothetical protein
VDIKARKTLPQLKARDNHKIRDQIRSLPSSLFPENGSNNKMKLYPTTPQTATGRFKIRAYGLCDTVSQLRALEMAQKLL